MKKGFGNNIPKKANPWNYTGYMGEFPPSRHLFSVNTAFQIAYKKEQELKNINLRQNSTLDNQAHTSFFNLN